MFVEATAALVRLIAFAVAPCCCFAQRSPFVKFFFVSRCLLSCTSIVRVYVRVQDDKGVKTIRRRKRPKPDTAARSGAGTAGKSSAKKKASLKISNTFTQIDAAACTYITRAQDMCDDIARMTSTDTHPVEVMVVFSSAADVKKKRADADEKREPAFTVLTSSSRNRSPTHTLVSMVSGIGLKLNDGRNTASGATPTLVRSSSLDIMPRGTTFQSPRPQSFNR